MKRSIHNMPYKWHLLGIGVFVLYEQGMISVFYKMGPPAIVGVFYTTDISLFYILACFSWPFFLSKTFKVLKVTFAIMITFLGYCVLQLLASSFSSWYTVGKTDWVLDGMELKKISFRFFQISGYSLVYFLSKALIAKASHNKDLEIKQLRFEKQHLELESAYLHAQINPHLLFNTLNYINHLVSNVSQKASTAILLLSDIMHYALQDIKVVKLGEELEQVSNYLELIKLRKDRPLQLNVEISVSDEMLQVPIPSLILTTIIENMLKHGDLYNSDQPALFSVTGITQSIFVKTRNMKYKNSSISSNGIGLKNIKRRLDLAYPEGYSLDIVETTGNFELNLTILDVL